MDTRMGVRMGIRTGDHVDVRRAICKAVRVDNYRAFLVLSVLRVSRALELRIKLRVEL